MIKILLSKVKTVAFDIRIKLWPKSGHSRGARKTDRGEALRSPLESQLSRSWIAGEKY